MSDFLSKFGEDLKNNVSGFIAVSITEVKQEFPIIHYLQTHLLILN